MDHRTIITLNDDKGTLVGPVAIDHDSVAHVGEVTDVGMTCTVSDSDRLF